MAEYVPNIVVFPIFTFVDIPKFSVKHIHEALFLPPYDLEKALQYLKIFVRVVTCLTQKLGERKRGLITNIINGPREAVRRIIYLAGIMPAAFETGGKPQ